MELFVEILIAIGLVLIAWYIISGIKKLKSHRRKNND